MLKLCLDANSAAQDTEHAVPALAVPANMRSASICAMQCSKDYYKSTMSGSLETTKPFRTGCIKHRLGVLFYTFIVLFTSAELC